jgi:hypothetical protein
MSELDHVASNAAPDTAAPSTEATAVETTTTPVAETENSTPSSSSREALERAFKQIEGQPRAPDGKFASAEPAPVDKQAGNAVAPQEPQKPVAPAQDDAQVKLAPSIDPPSRFAPAAKEAWANTPDPVKFEIERAMFEMGKGLEEYQAKFQPLKQFDEMAKASGKELPNVVAEYVNMENLLRSDPLNGFNIIAQRIGIDPRELGQALLNGGAQTEQPQQQQPAHTPEALARLEQRMAEMQQTFSQQQTILQIENFAKDHPRFDELSPIMAEMLHTGFAKDLSDAYTKAERIQPPAQPVVQQPTIAVPTATQAQAAQTRPVAKQITGSPSGSNPNSRPPAGSSREALKNAFASVGL